MYAIKFTEKESDNFASLLRVFTDKGFNDTDGHLLEDELIAKVKSGMQDRDGIIEFTKRQLLYLKDRVKELNAHKRIHKSVLEIAIQIQSMHISKDDE